MQCMPQQASPSRHGGPQSWLATYSSWHCRQCSSTWEWARVNPKYLSAAQAMDMLQAITKATQWRHQGSPPWPLWKSSPTATRATGQSWRCHTQQGCLLLPPTYLWTTHIYSTGCSPSTQWTRHSLERPSLLKVTMLPSAKQRGFSSSQRKSWCTSYSTCLLTGKHDSRN